VELGRREFLKGAAAAGLFSILPGARVAEVLAAYPASGGYYLTARRLATLSAMTYRMIPGPLDAPGPLNTPPETDPGAREAHCFRYVDILLAAFTFDPPMIHAGGPFSNRYGSSVDDFASFVPLDAHAELGWRIRIEGSRGIKAREFAGPVQGLQELYDAGLDDMDSRAMSAYGMHFADVPGAGQDALLLQAASPQDNDSGFIAMVFGHALEAMYGAPEYGGNQGLAGWTNIAFDGDVQPRGYSPTEVSTTDPGFPPFPMNELGIIGRVAPLLGGAPTPRDRFWLGRRPFHRG